MEKTRIDKVKNMDQAELFLACRIGDLLRVKYLVEQKEVEVNIRDQWDSTPLYYACLCGHIKVVNYLLENGARCEVNTFDGERCIYGALNSEIRNLLLEFKVVIPRKRMDNYTEFLRRCFETGDYHDLSFVVHGESFPAHCCVLLSRCRYFEDALIKRNNNKRHKPMHITNPLVTAVSFKAIIKYLYTGCLYIQLDYLDECIMLAKKFGLYTLIDAVSDKVKELQSFRCAKPGLRVTTLSVELESLEAELQQDFGLLAKQTLPSELHNLVGGNELQFLPFFTQFTCADMCLNVQGHDFFCHKIFFCGRSDYFKVLITDPFHEATEVGNIIHITLHDITVEIFLHILYYIYQNTTELTTSVVLDVLRAADIYMLPGLKKQCAVLIGQNLDVDNVVKTLRLAKLFDLLGLENRCTEFIAKHLEQVVGTQEFHEIVISDAEEIERRQETDSIPVIDEIRYHITCNVMTFSAMDDASEKLNVIDKLLERLGLDA